MNWLYARLGNGSVILRTSSRKGFASKKETMIWRKQFLYVFVQVAVSECSYYLEWSIVLHSNIHVPGLSLWLLMFSTLGL